MVMVVVDDWRTKLEKAEVKVVPDDDTKTPTCSVCLENERNCVLLPCVHECVCSKCCLKITICPICRCKIDRAVIPIVS